jgi:hypothetical protein
MNVLLRKARGVVALAVAVCAISATGWAQQEGEGPADEPLSAVAPPFWPNRFYLGDDAFTVYPPQFERWEGDRLEGRAAVAVEVAGAEKPAFGAVTLSARTDVDAASGMVTVHDFDAGPGNFPAAKDRASAYLDAVRRHLATLTWRVALARLQGDLAIDQAAERSQSQPVRNDPPRIVYVQSPTILVPIDGEPVLREITGSGLRRVVNTRALILQEQLTNRYFLYVAGYWLEASTLEGRWTEAQVRPMALDEAKQNAVAEGSVDLLEDDGAQSTHAPKVIVSTGPTELVQTDGPPQYAPIGRTDLLFVTNSPNRLFLDLRTQTHYVLLAGRWYRTPSLARGPWEFVPGADLPPDFAMIPPDHPTGTIRAAVPGTAEARESVIANSVPEIATVKRSAARLEITYDGVPEFRPIEGTTLEAAVNAPVPVIRVDWHSYYALDNGVWFFSESAYGPWTAATWVPAVVYTIPRSDPLHYVTYVRVYDATTEDVYVGYTPGYVGSYVTFGSTVVYGTGWYYRPWIGTVWYAPPVTWGFGFSFYYSWWGPWWPGPVWWAAWRPVPCFRPAWGPWPHYHAGVKNFGLVVVAPGHPPRPGAGVIVKNGRTYNRAAFRESTLGAGDIYRRWDSHSVSSPRPSVRVPSEARPSVRASDRNALVQPPESRQRDDRGSRIDRNERIGEGQRPVEAPHWVSPEDRVTSRDRPTVRQDAAPPRSSVRSQFGTTTVRAPATVGTPSRSPAVVEAPSRSDDLSPRWVRPEDRMNPRDRTAARPDAAPPHSPTRSQGGIPVGPPAVAGVPPRSPGLSARDPNAAGPRRFDGGGRFERRQQPGSEAPRSADRNRGSPSAVPSPRSTRPSGTREQRGGGTVGVPSGTPDAMRARGASAHQHDMRGDRAAPARAATAPATRITPPPSSAHQAPHANRGSRNR